MIVKLLVEGGNMTPGPAIAQQLGPMGINIGQVISKINQATAGFKGTKVPVELDINPKTKSYDIMVFSPPVAELIKKELTAVNVSSTNLDSAKKISEILNSDYFRACIVDDLVGIEIAAAKFHASFVWSV